MNSNKKDILFISAMKGDPWGGSEEFWFRMAVWMAGNGYNVDCAFYEWPVGREEKILQLKNAGCKIFLISNSKFAANFFEKLNKKRKAVNDVRQLLKKPYNFVFVSQGGFEEILHHPFKNALPVLKKFALIYHNYNDDRRLNERRKKRLHEWTHAASINIADAARVFTALKKVAGFDVPKQFVIINPITISVQQSPAGWPSLNANGNYVWVMMAQLDITRKAQDILVKALSSKKWQQRNWELYLYGAGVHKDVLSELISSSVVKDKIHLAGHTKEVEKVLRQSHLLLQITHIDAMPLSVTEAMNMSRACVVSKTGDMPLWIQDEINGFVAETVTEAGIDEVLEKAWEQKDKWQEQGVAAFETFRQKYPQLYEAYYEKIFAELM